MLSIRENLGSLEAANKYNASTREGQMKWRGCIGSLACVHCYHVIRDSICLCVGIFDCPKCGKKNGRELGVLPIIDDPSPYESIQVFNFYSRNDTVNDGGGI
jgi:hypothetical protein